MTSTIARQPAGRPTGGQFTATDRTEATITLDGINTARANIVYAHLVRKIIGAGLATNWEDAKSKYPPEAFDRTHANMVTLTSVNACLPGLYSADEQQSVVDGFLIDVRRARGGGHETEEQRLAREAAESVVDFDGGGIVLPGGDIGVALNRAAAAGLKKGRELGRRDVPGITAMRAVIDQVRAEVKTSNGDALERILADPELARVLELVEARVAIGVGHINS